MLEGEVENVVVRFSIPRGKSEVTVSDSMSSAFQVCQRYGLAIDWIQEERLVEMLNEGSLDGGSVVVVDPFYGESYSQLSRECRAGRLTVLGPSCLISCLLRNVAVPSTPTPLYSSAMRGVVVTPSGLEPGELCRYRELVEAMSGEWSPSLHDGVTHLVTKTVLSEKYRTASSLGLTIMRVSWLEDVWRSSHSPDLRAEDPAFSCHEAPHLLGVRVCVSGLRRQEREVLRRGVEEAGGEMRGELDLETSVLVCVSQEGQKWVAARRWGIPTVTTAWILDSLDQRRYLDTDQYRLELVSQESPVRPVPQPELNHEPEKGKVQTQTQSKTQTRTILQSIELSEVKKAGTLFLDGCTVFLAVTDREEEAKLAKVLKHAGAVRLSQLTERVTHIVQDTLEESSTLVTRLQELDISPAVVDVEWIVASMRAGRPVPTESVIETEVQEYFQQTTADNYTSSVDNSNFEEDLLAYYR